jgi:hypothetical protein
VPAKVAGTWGVYGMHPSQKATLQLVQYQQRVGGSLTIDQQNYPIMKPSLLGEKLKFSFQDKDQVIHDVELNMTGEIASGFDLYDYKTSKLVGKKEK